MLFIRWLIFNIYICKLNEWRCRILKEIRVIGVILGIVVFGVRLL